MISVAAATLDCYDAQCFNSGKDRERIEQSELSLYLSGCGCSSGDNYNDGGLSSLCCDSCRNGERVEHKQSGSKLLR